MADVFLFMRHGWKNIWRQKSIWLFSLLPILNQVFNVFQVKKPTDLFSSFVSLIASFIFGFLVYVSYVGVPYLAYCFLIGKPATIQETLSAIKKFAGRAIGCSCLGFLALSPVLFWVLAVSVNSSTHTLQISNKTILVLLPLSIFAAMYPFIMAVFFEKVLSLRRSLVKAWNIFISHFSVLAILGVILAIISRLYTATSGVLTVLIQSGFDITSINQLVLLNPAASLSKNLLFVLLDGIGNIIFSPLSATIFISAYLKYNDVKLPFLMRVK